MGGQTGELTESEAELLGKAFYMDDGMSSFYIAVKAVADIKRLITFLAKCLLHIHKINSNDSHVLNELVAEGETSSNTVVIEPN